MSRDVDGRRPVRFFAVYVLTLLACLSPGALSAAFLYRAWELRPFREIVREQLRTEGLYGSLTYGRLFPYKLELAKARRPVVMVLGSSTLFPIRQEFFNAPFTNAAGAMLWVGEGDLFLRRLLDVHRPAVLLLGVDFWFFNEQREEPAGYPGHSVDADTITLVKLLEPFTRVANGDVRPRDVLRVLVWGDRSNPLTDFNHLGFLAIHASTGYRVDGSLLYGKAFFGLFGDRFEDLRFRLALEDVARGRDKFRYGSKADRRKLARLGEMVRFAQERGVQVVTIVPPVAPPVFEKMRMMTNEFEFVWDMKRAVRSLGNEAYDFQGGDPVVANPCEYFDGAHAGDVTFARILLAVAERNPNSLLLRYLNKDALRDTVRRFSGRVLAGLEHGRYRVAESDFLHLGCPK